MDLKNDEVGNLKKEFERTLYGKEKKISELQGVINQTYNSYNSGMNNIKISNKINDEINSMMRKMRVEDIKEEEIRADKKESKKSILIVQIHLDR